MFSILFYLITLFFIIGAVAIYVLNKKSDAKQRRSRWVKYIFYLLVVCITTGSIQFGFLYYLAILILVIGVYEITQGWLKSGRSYAFLLLCLTIYLCISFGFYRFTKDAAFVGQILYVYTIVFTFDGFAQISGQLFGKAKILPRISPDKTIAGLIGGYIMGVITGIYMVSFLHPVGIGLWISPFVICTGAFIGDALASLYKRKCGVKDYSRLIPEHGGVLDRFDSFIFAGSLFWLIYVG